MFIAILLQLFILNIIYLPALYLANIPQIYDNVMQGKPKRAALDAAGLIIMEGKVFSMDFSGPLEESLSNDNIMVFTV